jgi:hypothetical protein
VLAGPSGERRSPSIFRRPPDEVPRPGHTRLPGSNGSDRLIGDRLTVSTASDQLEGGDYLELPPLHFLERLIEDVSFQLRRHLRTQQTR